MHSHQQEKNLKPIYENWFEPITLTCFSEQLATSDSTTDFSMSSALTTKVSFYKNKKAYMHIYQQYIT